jgi:DNA-binding transcriptional LysR family regulator
MKTAREIEILFRRLRLYDQLGRRAAGLVRTVQRERKERLGLDRVRSEIHASGLEVPRASVTVYSILMQSALLSSERFLSFLPATMLHFSARRLSMKVLPVEMPVQMWPIGIITLKGRTPNPAQRLLVECAQEVSKQLAGKRKP